jgi:hypothetical protein
MSYACSHCGREGKLHGGRRCTRCTLADRAAELLDDGTGRIPPRLAPLAGLLPAVDKPILRFERWLHAHLADLGDSEHAQILRRFATWNVLPRLRARAEARPLTPAGRRHAGEQIIQATALLGWLAGRTLADCAQADVELWHVEHTASANANIRRFLGWSAKTRLTRRFTLPTTAGPRRLPAA